MTDPDARPRKAKRIARDRDPVPDFASFLPIAEGISGLTEFGRWRGGERNEDGSFVMPWVDRHETVSEFVRAFHDCGIVFPFDWSGWDEGREMAEWDDFTGVDMLTLRKLLTAIIRNDRFCEGALQEALEDGVIQRIVVAMKAL
jgi:hypothetical protein